MKVLGIIPARYASSRFPGKPLADILGKPMLWHVYTRVNQTLNHIIIATDDQRIKKTAEGYGFNVVMTKVSHRSGTERCQEAAEIYSQKTGINFDLIINIQGDEPLIDPNIIEALIQNFDCKTDIATLIKQEEDIEQLSNPNKVKVIIDKNNFAIYFSRQIIPFLRDIPFEQWTNKYSFYTHIGIYAYRKKILDEIVHLPPSLLEKAEKLEQLRWLENGYKIKTIKTDYVGIGVDTYKDLEMVISMLKREGYEQF